MTPATAISFVAEDVVAIRAGRIVQVRRPGVQLARRVVATVRRERLQAVTDADCGMEGARGRDDFIRRWESRQAGGRTISGDASRWTDNPLVTVVTFTAVAEPLP